MAAAPLTHRRADYFVAKVEHLAELVEVTDPDHMDANKRRASRLVQEETKFDGEHYMHVALSLCTPSSDSGALGATL